MLTDSNWRTKARRAAVTDSHEGALWGDALDHVDAGLLDRPLSADEDGKLVTGEGLQLANPAYSLGA